MSDLMDAPAARTTDHVSAANEFSLEICPGQGTFTVEAAGLSESLCFPGIDDLVESLPVKAVRYQTVRTDAGEQEQLVVTEAGFSQAVAKRRKDRALLRAADQERLDRFLAWVDAEMVPFLREADAVAAPPARRRPAMTIPELAPVLFVRHGWDWSRSELGRRLHDSGVMNAAGHPTEAWGDCFTRAWGTWSVYVDALPRLERHLRSAQRTPRARTNRTEEGPELQPRVPDVVWRAPNPEPESAPSIDEQKADLVDDLMRHLPGPDGSGWPLGIIWTSGKATGTSVWREQLPGFHREIRTGDDPGDPELRRKLAARVWNLREFGDRIGLDQKLVSRLVYDFLISVVYACETHS